MKALHLFSIGVLVVTMSILFIPQADARTNYDVGVVLSKTCITMIKNNLTTTCPTYEEIMTLFPDNTNQNISGKFVYKDGYLQRANTLYLNHYKFYTYQPVTLWIDPPGDITGRIATITIEPSLPEYLIEESKTLKGNIQIVAHSRYVDPLCYRSTITATDWVYLTGDTIQLMLHNCDPAFTNFNHIKTRWLGESYQDIATSNKYKIDQMVKLAKEKYKVSYIGSNEIFDNPGVTTDEDEK